LLAFVDWWTEACIPHMALENTGEYWKLVSNLLEGSFTVMFVHAAHVKNAPGRKTDKADARWLAKPMRYGLLRASVIPPAGQRDLWDLPRYRTKFIQEGARAVNHVQGGLERANIKLASVASDIMGVSGRASPQTLATFRSTRGMCRIKTTEGTRFSVMSTGISTLRHGTTS
jgi:hypothetical protein